jgi:hypothetical protein
VYGRADGKSVAKPPLCVKGHLMRFAELTDILLRASRRSRRTLGPAVLPLKPCPQLAKPSCFRRLSISLELELATGTALLTPQPSALLSTPSNGIRRASDSKS